MKMMESHTDLVFDVNDLKSSLQAAFFTLDD